MTRRSFMRHRQPQWRVPKRKRLCTTSKYLSLKRAKAQNNVTFSMTIMLSPQTLVSSKKAYSSVIKQSMVLDVSAGTDSGFTLVEPHCTSVMSDSDSPVRMGTISGSPPGNVILLSESVGAPSTPSMTTEDAAKQLVVLMIPPRSTPQTNPCLTTGSRTLLSIVSKEPICSTFEEAPVKVLGVTPVAESLCVSPEVVLSVQLVAPEVVLLVQPVSPEVVLLVQPVAPEVVMSVHPVPPEVVMSVQPVPPEVVLLVQPVAPEVVLLVQPVPPDVVLLVQPVPPDVTPVLAPEVTPVAAPDAPHVAAPLLEAPVVAPDPALVASETVTLTDHATSACQNLAHAMKLRGKAMDFYMKESKVLCEDYHQHCAELAMPIVQTADDSRSFLESRHLEVQQTEYDQKLAIAQKDLARRLLTLARGVHSLQNDDLPLENRSLLISDIRRKTRQQPAQVVSSLPLHDYDKCTQCQGDLSLLEFERALVCTPCGIRYEHIDTSGQTMSTSYHNLDRPLTLVRAQRADRMRDSIKQLTARHLNVVQNSLVLEVTKHMYLEHSVRSIEGVTFLLTRNSLKELGYNNFLQYAMAIYCSIKGCTPPRLTVRAMESFHVMAALIEEPFERLKPQPKTCWFSSNYLMLTFSKFLGFHELIPFIALTRTRVPAMDQEALMIKIFADLKLGLCPKLTKADLDTIM